MKRLFVVLTVIIIVSSCKRVKKSEANTVQQPSDGFEMYEASEMAVLMRQMYEFNHAAKVRLGTGDISLPEDFSGIHHLEMTEPDERDAEYKQLADEFLTYQKQAFSAKDPDSAKAYFNRSVATCVACHKTRCTGPIPKIKKLYIR